MQINFGKNQVLIKFDGYRIEITEEQALEMFKQLADHYKRECRV